MNEIGVRVALGAPRLRFIVQTMLENVVLCALGGVLAILLAARALEATNGFMGALVGGDLPFWFTWSLDRDVVMAAGCSCFLTVSRRFGVTGVAVSKADPNVLLKDCARAGGARAWAASRERS